MFKSSQEFFLFVLRSITPKQDLPALQVKPVDESMKIPLNFRLEVDMRKERKELTKSGGPKEEYFDDGISIKFFKLYLFWPVKQ